ncbi:MAG: CHAD domain-containing protein [Acetobacteraceae bacterium]|nr:CHAD domain-containing protein [Acetobacteraceae bacterium]
MSTETELKFIVSPEARAGLERLPKFQNTKPNHQAQSSVYYDTPQYALVRQGILLRVRDIGGSFIQTIKTPREHEAAARGEQEEEVQSGQPELARSPLKTTVDPEALSPVFRTEINRTSRLFNLDHAIIEAAFDEGAVVAGNRHEPIRELELELKAGDPAGLHRFALGLHEQVPLVLGLEAKSDRGFRLLGLPPHPVKAPKLELEREIRTFPAFRQIISSILSHLLANAGPALHGDAEGVHQIRIAIRRLRSALMLFQPHLNRTAVAGFEAELKRSGRVFGETRDWDVFCLQSLPEARAGGVPHDWVDLLAAAAGPGRAAAHTGSERELSDPRWTGLILGLLAWVHEEPDFVGQEALSRRLRRTGPALLDRVAQKASRRARQARSDSSADLHALRKTLKKLRYDCEFMAGIYSRKRVKSYRKLCEDLQDLLGAINDAAGTTRLAELLRAEGHSELAPAAGALAEWSAARRNEALQHVPDALREFEAAAPFWK